MSDFAEKWVNLWLHEMFVKKTKHLDLLAVYKTINTGEHSDKSQHLLKLWPVMFSITSFICLLLLCIGRFLKPYDLGRQSTPRIQVDSRLQHKGCGWRASEGVEVKIGRKSVIKFSNSWTPPEVGPTTSSARGAAPCLMTFWNLYDSC